MTCPRCGYTNSHAVNTRQPRDLKLDRYYSRRVCATCGRPFMTLRFVLPELAQTHGGKPGRTAEILNSYVLTKVVLEKEPTR